MYYTSADLLLSRQWCFINIDWFCFSFLLHGQLSPFYSPGMLIHTHFTLMKFRKPANIIWRLSPNQRNKMSSLSCLNSQLMRKCNAREDHLTQHLRTYYGINDPGGNVNDAHNHLLQFFCTWPHCTHQQRSSGIKSHYTDPMRRIQDYSPFPCPCARLSEGCWWGLF